MSLSSFSGFFKYTPILLSPPIGSNRNKSQPAHFAKSNKGMQHWYKGKGVGLQGKLTKHGRFIRTWKTREFKPYVYVVKKNNKPKVVKEVTKKL